MSGDGCFLVRINKDATKIGFTAKLEFKINQHSKEAELMKSLVSYLGCGKYYPASNQDSGEFVVRGFSDIVEKIIPFFEKNHIKGEKLKDFGDFCKVADLMKEKAHLTTEGLAKIREIKEGMNRGRLN